MVRLLVALAALCAAQVAFANSYPSRPIVLVVPVPAGSGTDAMARIVAAPLGEALGTKIVVENRVGANTMVGTSSVARSTPDGYTLLMGGTTSHAAAPSLLKSLNYDPVRDFEPLGRVGVYPYALLVGGMVPAKSVAELVALAKAQPGALSFGHGNATGQLLGELLKRRSGVDMNRVPYRGSSQVLVDILGGRTTMMINDITAAVSQIQAGSVRALAVTGDQRTALMPDVPTMREEGFPGFDVQVWSALFAPTGTPPEIVSKLRSTLDTVLSQDSIRARLAEIGFEVLPLRADPFRQVLVEDIERWRVLTKEAGIEAQ